MAKRIEAAACPTCGVKHPSGTVQIYEIPEAPVVDISAFNLLREDVKSLGDRISTFKSPEPSIEQGFKQLDANLGKLALGLLGHPKPREVIKDWAICTDCGPEWNSIKKEIVDEALQKHHPVFNDKLIEHSTSCSDCKPGFDKFKQQIEQEALERAKAATAAIASEATAPAKSKSFWGIE